MIFYLLVKRLEGSFVEIFDWFVSSQIIRGAKSSNQATDFRVCLLLRCTINTIDLLIDRLRMRTEFFSTNQHRPCDWIKYFRLCKFVQIEVRHFLKWNFLFFKSPLVIENICCVSESYAAWSGKNATGCSVFVSVIGNEWRIPRIWLTSHMTLLRLLYLITIRLARLDWSLWTAHFSSSKPFNSNGCSVLSRFLLLLCLFLITPPPPKTTAKIILDDKWHGEKKK